MISPSVKEEIINRLAKAEVEHEISVLYACESGSRAWGFESPDSDYDVRFIYVRSEDWYLSFDVESKRDVIEYPIVDEIDCSGWDLKKALYLFTRTNGALLEWLKSPITYIDRLDFAANLLAITPRAIDKTALCYHYSHMARGNAREYLSHTKVKLKKYFYVLRPLLAIRFIEKYNTPPPVEFSELIAEVAPSALLAHVESLIALKRNTSELGYGDRVPEINQFVDEELGRHGKEFSGQGRPDILDGQQVRLELNELYRDIIRSAWNTPKRT